MFLIFFAASAKAACVCGCEQVNDPSNAISTLQSYHATMVQNTNEAFNQDLEKYEEWLVEIMAKRQIASAMMEMTTQMSAVAVQYTQMIGTFLDAQTQMDTQRALRVLQYEAHKDYVPSEDFCWFGTNVRSLAASGTKAIYNGLALSQIQLARQLGTYFSAGAVLPEDDLKSRWQQFVTRYCDVRDNNYQTEGGVEERTGLSFACDHDGEDGGDAGAEDLNRINRDVDYVRLIEVPRTLDVDFENNVLDVNIADVTDADEVHKTLLDPADINDPRDEEDVIALSKNLYGHNVLSRGLSHARLSTDDGVRKLYNSLRSVTARRGVAQASFNAIVGLKSSGTSGEPVDDSVEHPNGSTVNLSEKQTQNYLAAIVDELLPKKPDEGGNIYDLIGYNPSYYSQLEILGKRIYQNPDFYANLYDTPTNVERKKVAMKAVELMIDREIYESQLRREMSVSVLLATKLRSSYRIVNKELGAAEARDD